MVEKANNKTDGKYTELDNGFEFNQVFEKTQERIQNIEKIVDEKRQILVDKLPLKSKKPIYEAINGVVRSLVSPKDEEIKKRWFKNKNDKIQETTYELTVFYFYRIILNFFYLIFSIYRLFEFAMNRMKIIFLGLTYKCNDDPSVISSDINKLAKIPSKLSVILNYKSEQEEAGGIEGLCNDCSLIASWCVSSGITNLTVYEKTGILKKSINELSEAIFQKFESFFGIDNVPNFLIKIPHLNLSYSGIDRILIDNNAKNDEYEYDIEISLLSLVDGRSTIVELTKVMSQLVKNKELKKSDISVDFLDYELKQLIGDEPELIIMFQPFLDLQGYPPWHIRLTEIYWEADNDSVSYVVFLRALQKYSTCKVNIGK